MAKIYDEVYKFEVFTEEGRRWVKCSHSSGEAIYLVKPFKTREELNQAISDYIEDVDKVSEYGEMWGL